LVAVFALPVAAVIAARPHALFTSLPPPLPKIEPTTAATAIVVARRPWHRLLPEQLVLPPATATDRWWSQRGNALNPAV